MERKQKGEHMFDVEREKDGVGPFKRGPPLGGLAESCALWRIAKWQICNLATIAMGLDWQIPRGAGRTTGTSLQRSNRNFPIVR